MFFGGAMENKVLTACWLMCLGIGLEASGGWQNKAQLGRLAVGTMHYLQAAGQKAFYQPPVIDKEWRVFNDTPYTILINGNPVEPDMVLTGSGCAYKGAQLVVAESIVSGTHFKPFTIKLLQEYSPIWTKYVAITLKPGLMWGLRVNQYIAEYTDNDIASMVLTHSVLKHEPERTEWQITNRSSYDLTIDGVPLAKGSKMDGKLADSSLIRVKAEQLERWGFGPLDINLSNYKGLLLRQRNQWLKIDIVNKSLFSQGIDYRISRIKHVLLWGNLFSGNWSTRWPRDAFIGAAALTLIHDRAGRVWRAGSK